MQTPPDRTTSEYARQIRIGDLLIQAGIVTPQEITEGMEMATTMGLPIGKVMVMMGYLQQEVLQAAVQSQALLRDGMLQMEMALRALRKVHTDRVTLAEALRLLGWTPAEDAPGTKLGDLLEAAGLVTREDLAGALKTSRETGLPLGRVLFATGKVSDATLWAALNAQVMIRDRKIARDQAIKALRAAFQRQVAFDRFVAEQGLVKMPGSRRVKLGELLVMAGFLSQETLLTALEVGLMEEKPLGQVLLARGIISRHVLDTALKVQELVETNNFLPLQAAEILRISVSGNIPISQAVAELGLLVPRPHETIRLGELLQLSELLSPDDLQEALRLSLKNGTLLGKILVATGQLDEHLVHAALRGQFLIREGLIQQDQALIALNYCRRMQCAFDDALSELGFTPSSEPAGQL